MVICISDWPTATRIGNVTASHSHTHDYYFSDWPTAAHIRNVTESYLQLFVYRVSRMEKFSLCFETCLQSVLIDQNVLVSRLPPKHIDRLKNTQWFRICQRFKWQ